MLLPVLCSYLLRGKIKEPKYRLFDHIRRGYGVLLGWCLRNRTVSMAILLSIFAASLLLIPLIGAEFMPHLDEGALWMRATAPYTISFEEASKLSPQIRDILRSFPAGDHGCERAGTSRRRNGFDGLFQQRVLHRTEALRRSRLAGIDSATRNSWWMRSTRRCRLSPA